jgi:hypothetical protein
MEKRRNTYMSRFGTIVAVLLLLNAVNLCSAGIEVKENPGKLTLEPKLSDSLACHSGITNPARQGDENIRFAYGSAFS